jgi:membrane protein YqaA with SNARE-associated domain
LLNLSYLSSFQALMSKLLGFVGTFLGSSVGWWLGAKVGIMTAVLVSAVGTGVGLYAGRRLAANYDL